MRRQRVGIGLTVLAAACFLGLGGCTQETAGVDVTGGYALVSVDGHELPAEVGHDGVSIRVESGAFTIGADGTCESETVFAAPSGQSVTRKVDATYTLEGNELTMQWQGAGTTTGNVEGDVFTMNNEGMIFAYERR